MECHVCCMYSTGVMYCSSSRGTPGLWGGTVGQTRARPRLPQLSCPLSPASFEFGLQWVSLDQLIVVTSETALRPDHQPKMARPNQSQGLMRPRRGPDLFQTHGPSGPTPDPPARDLRTTPVKSLACV